MNKRDLAIYQRDMLIENKPVSVRIHFDTEQLRKVLEEWDCRGDKELLLAYIRDNLVRVELDI